MGSRPTASGKPSSHWPPPDGDRDTTRDSLGTQRLGEKLFQGPKTTRGFSSTNYLFHENCSSVPDSAHCGCWLPPLLVVTPLSSTLHISHMVHRDLNKESRVASHFNIPPKAHPCSQPLSHLPSTRSAERCCPPPESHLPPGKGFPRRRKVIAIGL